MHRKIGLVLDGGGGKGAYQIGVWKAMRETGLDKDIAAIAGTSVGGLNAALFVMNDYSLAEHIWTEEIGDMHPWNIQMVLERIIDEHFDLSVFRRSKIDCFLTTYTAMQSGEFCETNSRGVVEKYVTGNVTYFNLRTMDETNCRRMFKECSTPKAVMLATSALPVLCRRIKIGNDSHVDGGVPWGGDNSPVYPLSWKGANCDTIIVIHLDPLKDRIAKDLYPDIQILEIIPSVEIKGFLIDTLNFKPKHARKLIDAGYKDALRCFHDLIENQNLKGRERNADERISEWRRNRNRFDDTKNK
jgi:NTE family protein